MGEALPGARSMCPSHLPPSLPAKAACHMKGNRTLHAISMKEDLGKYPQQLEIFPSSQTTSLAKTFISTKNVK